MSREAGPGQRPNFIKTNNSNKLKWGGEWKGELQVEETHLQSVGCSVSYFLFIFIFSRLQEPGGNPEVGVMESRFKVRTFHSAREATYHS